MASCTNQVAQDTIKLTLLKPDNLTKMVNTISSCNNTVIFIPLLKLTLPLYATAEIPEIHWRFGAVDAMYARLDSGLLPKDEVHIYKSLLYLGIFHLKTQLFCQEKQIASKALVFLNPLSINIIIREVKNLWRILLDFFVTTEALLHNSQFIGTIVHILPHIQEAVKREALLMLEHMIADNAQVTMTYANQILTTITPWMKTNNMEDQVLIIKVILCTVRFLKPSLRGA
ncbi:MAG: hypothetical protein Q8R83_06320 [Legionellaceae bacterium]|nr:hypothetical protein [Legionellaceae bacterium]